MNLYHKIQATLGIGIVGLINLYGCATTPPTPPEKKELSCQEIARKDVFINWNGYIIPQDAGDNITRAAGLLEGTIQMMITEKGYTIFGVSGFGYNKSEIINKVVEIADKDGDHCITSKEAETAYKANYRRY